MPKNWRENLKFKIKKLEKGDTFYDFDGYKNHILDFMTDENTNTKLVVYKFWSKYKQRWCYECDPLGIMLYRICLLYEDALPRKDRPKFYEMNGINPKGWVINN